MVSYVLGAGASLHAGYPFTSDLGSDLVDWARRNWSDDIPSRGFVEAFHEHYGKLPNLESNLTELYERPSGSQAQTLSQMHCGGIISAIKVAIPEFFNSLRLNPLDGPDLYGRLAREKLQRGDAVITFNYDLAAERALKTEGLWEIGDGYGFSLGVNLTPPSATKVLKLHGSTNWLGVLFGGNLGFSQVSSVYDSRPMLFRHSDFDYLGYCNDVRDPRSKYIRSTGGEPALILPTLHKDFFHQTSFGREWEPFWNDIWDQAEAALKFSEKIVIVGYSMPTADERARELLFRRSNPGAEIAVYSGSRTSTICREFLERGFRVKSPFGRCRFEDYLAG